LNLTEHLHRQKCFSLSAFGPGPRTTGVVDHIRKELAEIRAVEGKDLMEWIDVVILGCDGAMRAGFTPEEISSDLTHGLVPLGFLNVLSGSVADTQDIDLVHDIEANLDDVVVCDGTELQPWTSIVSIALLSAMKEGFSPEEIITAWVAKQEINEKRNWPDWRTVDPNKAIEHVREGGE
jgi:hypothetical protein